MSGFVLFCLRLGGEKEGTGKHLQGSGHRDNVWSHKKGLLKARRVSYGVCRTEC